MNKDTLKTHALMLLNMYGVKEQDIKDRPECLNVFLNEILEQPKEKWEDRFDKYRLYFVGDESFNRAKDFIRETIKTEIEQAIKEERVRILKEVTKHRISELFLTKRLNMLKGLSGNSIYNKAIDDIKEILTN
jgi:hypothetical protein